jgi:arylsulfatase A-like enzyme
MAGTLGCDISVPRRKKLRRVSLCAGVLFALGVGIGLGSCGRRAAHGRQARHVVLISMDTSRADHFGFMGSEEVKTPRLDEVADESIVFTDYMTVVPTTLASHTSLFTGKYAHHHGTPRNGFMVNEANEMLPEILKGVGFRTVGFLGSFALSSRFNFNQGFDYYDENFDVRKGDMEIHQTQRVAADVTDAVIRYLEENGVPERLFLFVHYFDPHRPYEAPAPFDKAYDPQGRKALPSVEDVRDGKRMTPDERTSNARRQELQYASEISYMDHHIGRLLDDLRTRGVLDDALLVVTSDHGENLWDHYVQFDHGNTVYQSTVHAVCMMRLPGGERGGTRVESLVANIDVLPTVLGFLGLAAPDGIDGRAIDLRAVSGSLPERAYFSQGSKPHEKVETDPRWVNMLKSRCVRKGRYKFIQTPYKGSEELYDLISDPGERRNLLEGMTPETEAVVGELRRELEAWAASANPLESGFEKAKEEDTTKRLRSLGYVD